MPTVSSYEAVYSVGLLRFIRRRQAIVKAGCGNTGLIKRSFLVAFNMLRSPLETLEQVRSEKTRNAVVFLLSAGAVTALLTPIQVLLGFEDINGLHAGGQAEYLASDVSAMFKLGLEYRPVLIEVFYVFILLFSTGYLHVILKVAGGKGSVKDTFKMIAYGDAPGLLFGWIPYFATVAAVWAAVIQLLIGPVTLHQLSWTRAIVIFSILLGIGLIEIALS